MALGISRGRDAAGFCNTEPPANVLPVHKVVTQMRNHLGNVKIHHVRGDQANWRREVRSFSEQLREAWERAVEDVVSPVIKRLAKKVQIDGLIRLTVLQEQDCHDMREAYGRCSQLLHSQPGELNQSLPTPDEIEAEIAALASWAVGIIARQEQVCQRRRKILPLGRSKSRPVWWARPGACGPHIASTFQGALAVRPILLGLLLSGFHA